MKICRSWLLLCAALIGIVGHVNALRATSLIFGKQLTATTKTTVATPTSSTTSTSTVAPKSDENIAEESSDNTNSSKPVLTGIPQIDYIWDPNLPRELNGFNLTNYPFLVTVPATEEEIGFKCAGLHDGFYASIKWNCQLYHHCLHGVRYDFLCANFTAFDQKTFICHFVSEVDCKNSAKYWFRNDALYVATTTSTTPRPVTQPSISATPRPYGNRPRRPLRRRPQIDYYEEDYAEYDDPPPPRRRKNQKPRNRRPDFDDYTSNSRGSYADDEQYEAKPAPIGNRNRQDDDVLYERPANRNRNKSNRRKPQYEYEDRPAYDQEKRRKPSNDRRKIVDDEEIVEQRRPLLNDRRKIVDEEEIERRPLVNDRRKISDGDELERRPLANERRKYNDDRRINYEDDIPPKRQYEDDYEERPMRKKPPSREQVIEEVPQVKPTSSASSSGGVASLFNNPRKPPKISRPVPITEKKKFQYASNKPDESAINDSEYYDDYEEIPQRPRKTAQNSGVQPIREPAIQPEEITKKRAVSNSRPGRLEPKPFKRPAASIQDEEYYEDDYEVRNPPAIKKRPLPTNEYEERISPSSQKRPLSNIREKSNSPAPPLLQSQQQPPPASRNRFKDLDEYVEPEKKLYVREKYSDLRGPVSQNPENPLILKKDNYNLQSGAPDYRDYTHRQQDNEKYVNSDRDISTNKNTNSNKQAPKSPLRTPYDEPMSREEEREVRPIIRVVKRPFLPSRGGSPYLPRGLQPVGNNARAVETSSPKNSEFNIKVDSKENPQDYDEPQPSQQNQSGAKRKPTLDEIYDSEYDVTLNDALNPTLKPLTSNNNNRYQSTSYSELTFAPSHIRRTHLNPPITLATTANRKLHSRIPVPKLDSYEEDYEY